MTQAASQDPASVSAGNHAIGLRGHPPGLRTLFFTELWERFSYYGMRALLVLFMVAPATSGGMGLSAREAAHIYGNYTMAVYMLAIPGGFIADYLLGHRRSVLVGGIIIACGHFALAVDRIEMFYAGLVLIVLGTGLLKPSISALVGGLYAKNDERRDAGFSIFYMGINLGAFLAPFVTGFLAQSDIFKSWLEQSGFDPAGSWHWGFGAAGVGMVLGLIVYILQADRIAHIGERPKIEPKAWLHALFVLVGTGAALTLSMLSGKPGFEWVPYSFLLIPAAGIIYFAAKDDLDARRVAAIGVFFIAAMIFWAVFEQAGSTIALFGDQLTRTQIFGWNFPSSWFQSLNSLFVIMLAPIFAWAFVRLGPNQPSSPVKFAIGLIFLGLSFALMVPAAILTVEGKVSPLWIVGLFFLQTVGELFLSPVGLSTMTKLAPARLVSLVLGVWFLAAAWGSKLAGLLASEFNASDPQALAAFFQTQAIMVAIAAALMLAVTPWVHRLMGEIR